MIEILVEVLHEAEQIMIKQDDELHAQLYQVAKDMKMIDEVLNETTL